MSRFKLDSYIIVQALIAGCLNIGELINGFAVGWSAPMITKLQDLEKTPLPYLISEAHQSWIASVIYFGGFAAFISGFLANKIGRKKTIIVGGVLNLFSNILLIAARNLTMLYIGRILVGASASIEMVSGLIYIGEIASPNIRGVIMTSLGVFHALGSLLVYCVAPFMSYAGIGYVLIPLCVLFIIASCFLPESPMFYVIKNDEASARSVFQYLGRDMDINSELKTMMEKYQQQQQEHRKIWRELLTVYINKFSLFITICLVVFQYSNGIVTVIFFSTTIFEEAGSSVRPDISTIIIGVTFVVGACVSPLLIEKYGRRVLLIVSTAGCCIFMAVLGVYFYLKTINHPYIERLGWLPLTSLVATIFIFSLGLSIIPNTIAGELFTPAARGLGTSVCMIFGWISGFISSTLFGYAVVALGSHVVFWIFATINGLAFLFAVAFVPETKGKSLVEIQIMLENRRFIKQAKKQNANADSTLQYYGKFDIETLQENAISKNKNNTII